MIDIDAIPLDLAVQQAAPRQPVVTVYLATVETLPNGRVKVMPHHRGPVWQWFAVRRPTSAHGVQGQGEATTRPSGTPSRATGERGAPGRGIHASQ